MIPAVYFIIVFLMMLVGCSGNPSENDDSSSSTGFNSSSSKVALSSSLTIRYKEIALPDSIQEMWLIPEYSLCYYEKGDRLLIEKKPLDKTQLARFQGETRQYYYQSQETYGPFLIFHDSATKKVLTDERVFPVSYGKDTVSFNNSARYTGEAECEFFFSLSSDRTQFPHVFKSKIIPLPDSVFYKELTWIGDSCQEVWEPRWGKWDSIIFGPDVRPVNFLTSQTEMANFRDTLSEFVKGLSVQTPKTKKTSVFPVGYKDNILTLVGMGWEYLSDPYEESSIVPEYQSLYCERMFSVSKESVDTAEITRRFSSYDSLQNVHKITTAKAKDFFNIKKNNKYKFLQLGPSYQQVDTIVIILTETDSFPTISYLVYSVTESSDSVFIASGTEYFSRMWISERIGYIPLFAENFPYVDSIQNGVISFNYDEYPYEPDYSVYHKGIGLREYNLIHIMWPDPDRISWKRIDPP